MGSFNALAQMQPADTAELVLHRTAARQMGLRDKEKIAYYRQGKTVKTGPVVGILTAGQGVVPGNREMFRFVQRACQQAGLVAYVFTPADVDWTRNVVRGYQYRQGRWQSRRFPLPDVVYNRVPNRQLERGSAVRLVKQRLRSRGIPYYNSHYLNKYDLYRILRDTEVEPHLPWTRSVSKTSDIAGALRRFGSVYLKPKHAFAGKGILRVDLRPSGWTLRYRMGRNREVNGSTLAALWPVLHRHMGGKGYVVQQAIPLARYQGRAFDVRLLAQKNEAGYWQVTGMGIRVAGKGSITTHVPNGGFIASADKVIPEVFGSQAAEVRENVVRLALMVAPIVEKSSRGLFGEMSMDIGIDRQGWPWFFEANAKPMRFDESGIRRRGLATLVAYAKYLAGVPEGGG